MFDMYPVDEIDMPASEEPPRGMPAKAWSNSAELYAYSDMPAVMNASGLAPGMKLPRSKTLELRRAYYAAVSHMDHQLGRVMAALENSIFANDTVM